MEMRNGIQKSGIWLAAILLAGAGVVIYHYVHPTGYHPPTSAYFVDEDTGEEFVRPATDIPPLEGKNKKPTVVREFKYSLDGGKTSKVGYYYKYTESMKQKLDAAIAAGHGGDIDGNPGELVRAPAAGNKWVLFGSPEADAITHVDIPANADIVIMTP
jgi:hypothetical protein